MNEMYLQIEITNKCNLRCKHCYIDDYTKNLNYKDFVRYFQHISKYITHNNKSINVAITGGEPLVNPDWKEIILYLKSQKIVNQIVIFTNSTLIDADAAYFINNVGITNIQVSLDGVSKIHDEIRGKGNYQKAVNGIKNLTVPVTIHITINSKNIDNFSEFVSNCHIIGISYILVSKFVVLGSGEKFKDFIITPDEWHKFYKKNKILNNEYKDKLFINFDRLYTCLKEHKLMSSGCGIGEHSFSLLQNGDIMLCRRLPFTVGNLNNNSFQDIWCKNKFIDKIRNRENLKGKCGICKYKKNCGGCRATAYSLTNDVFEHDQYCLINKIK